MNKNQTNQNEYTEDDYFNDSIILELEEEEIFLIDKKGFVTEEEVSKLLGKR